MKKAFTMIELIFVIVVIGVLAAIAIPRISATRDDAALAKSMTDIAVALQDINAYYVSQGKLALETTNKTVKFREMTNAGTIDSSGALGFLVKDDECLAFEKNYDKETNLRVKVGEQGLCKRLWETPEFKKFRETIKPAQGATPAYIEFGASRVAF